MSKSSAPLVTSQDDEIVFLGSQTHDSSQTPEGKPRRSKHSSKEPVCTKLPDDAFVPEDGKSNSLTSAKKATPLPKDCHQTTKTDRKPSKRETTAKSVDSPSKKGTKAEPSSQSQDKPTSPDPGKRQPPENPQVLSHVDSSREMGNQPKQTTQAQDQPTNTDPEKHQPPKPLVPSHIDSVIICNGYWTTEDTPTTELASDDFAQRQKIDSRGVQRIPRVSVIDLR